MTTTTDLAPVSTETRAPVSTEARAPSPDLRWRRVRRAALATYVVGLAAWTATKGVPTDRLSILVATLTLLTIVVLGRGWRAWGQMMLDWLPFQAVLIAYDYSRGVASPYAAGQAYGEHRGSIPLTGVHNSLGLPLHVTFPISVDLWLGDRLGLGGQLPTTWVQEHFHPGTSLPWYGLIVSLVYGSHFVVMPIVAIVLWIRKRERFRVWMNMVIALAVAGLATYFLFPMAPPWLASAGGLFPGPRVGRYSTEGFDLIGLHLVRGMVSHGQHIANPVAAMPSLHMGYATLATGFLWFCARWWVKALLACYPLAMGFTLLYGGEHYLVDVLAGAACALAIVAVWRVSRRVRGARTQRGETGVPQSAGG